VSAARWACVGAAGWIALAAPVLSASERWREDFEGMATDSPLASQGGRPLGADGWRTATSESATLALSLDGAPGSRAMRLDFDFHGASGFVIARKDVALELPENYRFTFRLRGEAPPGDLEFKLVDPSGANVWWFKQPAFAFPADWRRVVIRKPQLAFAWGPVGGGSPSRIGAIEIAISGAGGGRGSVWIDDLRLEEREPPDRTPAPPKVSASSSLAGRGPELVLERDRAASWHSAPGESQSLQLDFGKPREYGGLIIDWEGEDFAVAYRVESSDDGREWSVLYEAEEAAGARDYVYLPEGESRFLRLALSKSGRGQGYGINRIQVAPLEFSASPNRFVQAIAREAPRGFYPRWLLDEQTYWAVVGADDDDLEALLSVDGMLEVGKESFSIEPFLYSDGHLDSWASVQSQPSLEDGDLPIPTVRWDGAPLALRVTAFAAGPAGASVLYARYRVENPGAERRRGMLYLAVRPFQVSPPWQSLNMTGGVARIHRLEAQGDTLCVNGVCPVVALSAPEGFGATRSEEGPVTRFLAKGRLPPDAEEIDPVGFSSGAFAFPIDLAPGGHDEVSIAMPFHARPPDLRGGLSRQAAAAVVAKRLAETAAGWRARLAGVAIELPPDAEGLVRAMRASLAWILVNRDGPRIQPGSRCYERSWIRDGAITSSALLQLGDTEPVRDFLRWYAPYQGSDGHIPCCVDARGPDPVPEHDSHGEFIWAVAEYWRFTHDDALLAEMWPRVAAAAEYIARLRAQRTGDAYRQPARRAFYGLLPESISHEGYAAKPVHSYWDDFFALRGLRDAAALAAQVGDRERAGRFAVERDELRDAIYASMAEVMKQHRLDTIPASVELADFDPNSTAIALAPGGERARLPAAALARTYDRYFDELRNRRKSPPESYTAYEVRSVEALVRLGQKDRAHELLDFLLSEQRPPAWLQWPEITWTDAKAPRFLGDLPHGWIASSFLRAARSFFVYEREEDSALVLAAGVPASWLQEGGAVRVASLPTWWGRVGYTLRADGADRVRLSLSGDLEVPAGGIVVASPFDRPLRSVTVGGRASSDFDASHATLRGVPAEVVLGY